MQPTLIIDAYDQGAHNRRSGPRVAAQKLYKDSSTVCLIPTRGKIAARVVQSWWNLAAPMNQAFIRMFIAGYEVGSAYSTAIEQILAMPGIQDFQFVLTLEEDNMPPPDGLLKLVAAMHQNPQFDAIGGLYWTKGEGGQPMIYGNPAEFPLNFRPQTPVPNGIQECNGLGMGFTLFRMSMFRDDKLPRPPFQTVQKYAPNSVECYTQDLFFFERAHAAGHRFACHTGVCVGHYDADGDMVW